MSTITRNGFGVFESTDCVDGMEMLKSIGGNFTIEKAQVSYPRAIIGSMGGVDNNGNVLPEIEMTPIEAYLPVRSDTGENISNMTIGEGYNVLQNSEVIDMVNTICGTHGMNYRYMTLVSGGRGLAVQVECPDLTAALSIGGDENRGNLTITNFHDGTGALKVHVSLKRMFCANTLPALNREFRTMKRANHRAAHSIKHCKTMDERIANMVETYQESMNDMVSTSDLLRKLAAVRITAAEKREYFKRLVNADGKAKSELTKRALTMRETKMSALLAASRNPVNQVEGAGLTWYEALQAPTHFGTHGMRLRDTGRGGDDEMRFVSSEMGAGAEFSTFALETALEMAGVK